jgi:adenylate cyclase
MTVHWIDQAPGMNERKWRAIERPLRLTTGLILFSYATSHFINHAFGMRSVEAMQAASAYLLAPWQTRVGLWALYTSFIVHALLGLHALFRRRHLRMPAGEAWQLGLGLTIPLLLIPHAGAIRIGSDAYGLEYSYARLMYQFWVVSPNFELPRQLLLLLVVWGHGCIGLRAWLQWKWWYPRASAALASLATLVPVLALLGVVSAGLDMRDLADRNDALALRLGPPNPATAAGARAAALGYVINALCIGYVALVAGTLLLRAARNWHIRRFGALRVTYPGDRVVTVPAGFSVLEASRWAGIPHESICGGRGRCSTCRVSITAGVEALLAPGPNELRTLDRIDAPPHVRLACQIRPSGDVSVRPLVAAKTLAATAAPARFAAAIEGGREREIVAMFVDLRESTRLATGRLPYDALFLLDRYIQVVIGAVRQHTGHVTSVAGDGVMSVFGAEGSAAAAARNAFQAALEAWTGLVSLNAELATELEAPLRIGIGLHAGLAVVGWLPSGEAGTLQFLGDTGNVAAKLEAETKQLDCTVIASIAALDLIVPDTSRLDVRAVSISGRMEAIEVAVFKEPDELQRLLS